MANESKRKLEEEKEEALRQAMDAQTEIKTQKTKLLEKETALKGEADRKIREAEEARIKALRDA